MFIEERSFELWPRRRWREISRVRLRNSNRKCLSLKTWPPSRLCSIGKKKTNHYKLQMVFAYLTWVVPKFLKLINYLFIYLQRVTETLKLEFGNFPFSAPNSNNSSSWGNKQSDRERREKERKGEGEAVNQATNNNK